MAMTKRRNEEKRTYWRAVFERQARSGLSIAKFCHAEGMSQASFYWWKRNLGTSRAKARKPERSPATRPLRAGGSGTEPEAMARNVLRRRSRPSVAAPRFVPVRITGAHRGRMTIRVAWPNGLSVRIPAASDPAEVENVLRLVDRLAKAT
jgi:hypothetical protein